MAYTDDDRAAALATLEANRGNLNETSRATGISPRTLNRWASENAAHKTAVEKRLPHARASLSERLSDVAHQLLDVIPDKLTDANLREIAVTLGIAIDKAQLLTGNPTSREEVLSGLSDAERAERVNELLDAARARRTRQAPTNPN